MFLSYNLRIINVEDRVSTEGFSFFREYLYSRVAYKHGADSYVNINDNIEMHFNIKSICNPTYRIDSIIEEILLILFYTDLNNNIYSIVIAVSIITDDTIIVDCYPNNTIEFKKMLKHVGIKYSDLINKYQTNVFGKEK